MTVVLQILRLRAKPRYFVSLDYDEMDALLSILDYARSHMETIAKDTGSHPELLRDLDTLEPELYRAFKRGM